MLTKIAVFPLALLALALAGCASDRNAAAEAMAQSAGLVHRVVPAGDFALTTFSRIADPSQPVTVYIEGYGLAWRTRYEPSLDPTPRKAIGLALAVADRSANVVYLARPCQFTPPSANPRCGTAYWTDKRFAPEVIAATDAAIDKIVGGGTRINLVGYSGGGAVAVLVAARRSDVASIRTVAGNLDHDEVNRIHRVSPMPGSLNAIAVAARVASVPQIHFSGGDDETVPPAIAERFRAAAGGRCVKTRVVAGASHESGWPERWPSLLAMVPSCD